MLFPNIVIPVIFQSTRPHGGATQERHQDDQGDRISIHAPAWGRDNDIALCRMKLLAFQSTRPHGGATVSRQQQAVCRAISIHAPAWGRDRQNVCAESSQDISIHAPAWGRDLCFHLACLLTYPFQSTRPHGGATIFEDADIQSPSISIHAPAWGRDCSRKRGSCCTRNFNPRARMGARLPAREGGACSVYFNPRARMGARRISRSQHDDAMAFQSTRPHGGATPGDVAVYMPLPISIHAPAWGRDLPRALYTFAFYDFNPRARMGARPPCRRCLPC